jgi:very-short-patch-repair endonuclease
MFNTNTARRARAKLPREVCVKGGKAYVEKYGKDSLCERSRRYRLLHPSEDERRLLEVLRLCKARTFEREYHIVASNGKYYYLDVAWPHLKRAIEVEGEVHRRIDGKADRDMARLRDLRGMGWQILIVDFASSGCARSAVEDFAPREEDALY